MAKSKVQFIDSIMQEVTRFSMTDDNAFAIAQEFINDKIDGYRATILTSYANQKQGMDSLYQIVNCITPECLGVSCKVGDITLDASSEIWVADIPELLDIQGAIKYFGAYDLSKAFTKTSLTAMARSENRWGRHSNLYARVGNKFYFKDNDATIKFTLIGIFSNPSDVCGFKDNDPYPLPKALEQQLELLVKKDLFTMFSIPLDVLNDAQDVIQQVPKQQQDA
ncbi:MAG: hypothetical protein JXR64_02965 [Spirochaetales bacterium]|nr:hypothetical protein [Spirochaetales bacterium]